MSNKNYFMFLGSYDHPLIPTWTPHTFAYFFSDEEHFCISWLPESGPGDVKILSKAVPGKNYTISETLNFLKSNKLKFIDGGTFEITHEHFASALLQFKKLNSHDVRYKVLGVKRNTGHDSYHCVYAISDIKVKPLMNNGVATTSKSMRKITKHFKQYIIKENVNHLHIAEILKKHGIEN
mgnify:CR=1 FL=1